MEQAIRNAEMDYWDLVSNRLYYSMFHAVTALMLIDGIRTSTHKGSSSQFGRFYVLTGKFSREDGMLYSRLQTMREKADYQNVFILPKEQGEIMLNEAKLLQGRIIDMIKESF